MLMTLLVWDEVSEVKLTLSSKLHVSSLVSKQFLAFQCCVTAYVDDSIGLG